MQLVVSVHDPAAAEQCAACAAMGELVLVCISQWLAVECMSVAIAAHHAHTGAATLGIIHKQGCVVAAEVVNLPPQLDKLAFVLVSRRLSVLDSVEGVDTGGQTHACVCGAGYEWRGMLSLEVRYASLQLAVRLLVGVHFALCLSELSVCS